MWSDGRARMVGNEIGTVLTQEKWGQVVGLPLLDPSRIIFTSTFLFLFHVLIFVKGWEYGEDWGDEGLLCFIGEIVVKQSLIRVFIADQLYWGLSLSLDEVDCNTNCSFKHFTYSALHVWHEQCQSSINSLFVTIFFLLLNFRLWIDPVNWSISLSISMT